MKKTFIIYASAGQGHKKAAEVLHRFLSGMGEGEVRLIDALDYSNGFVRWAYTSGYNFVVRRCQWLWRLIFFGSSLRLPFGLNCAINSLTNRMSSGPLYDLLISEQPDLVVSTHFLPSQVAAWLKGRKKIASCLVTVITDFGVHPFWEAEHTDLYACASEQTKQQLLKLGAKEETIRVTGIPVDPSFVDGRDKAACRKELGIEQGQFTVLLVTGSFGIGPLEEIARGLHKDCRVLVVCARNEKLRQALTAARLPNVSVFGFIRNLDQLMAASDIVVTKPGGLSVSELLALNSVPVFISAIPGQETGNVAALAAEGIGNYCHTPTEVRQTVLHFKDHPEKIARAHDLIARIRKPRSAEEISHAIRACCTRPAR